MAVREFDGTDDVITCAIGALAGVSLGGHTHAAIVKRDAEVWRSVFSTNTASAGRTALGCLSTSSMYFYNDGGNIFDSGSAGVDDGSWFLIAIDKATGTATTRWHVYDFTGAAWSHGNLGGGVADGGTPGASGVVQIGAYHPTSPFEFWDGRLAVCAIFDQRFTDGEWESSGMEAELQAWVDAAPIGLWPLNQASTSDPVEDITGNGADQTAITGTTVVTGDDPPGFDFSLGGGATDVTPADAAHAHTADQPALTQVHQITSADAAHAHTADQPALTQVHQITPADAAHAHTADQPALTQVHALASDDALHAHTADQPALTQVHQITPADAAHAHSADQPAVSVTGDLAAADALHAHTADQPALTQVHVLAPDSATHAHTADQPSITSGVVVTPNDASHAHTADQPALTQVHVLAPDSATHGHTADQPTITQLHILVTADSLHAHSADQPTVAEPEAPPAEVSGGYWALKAILDERRREYVRDRLEDRCPYDDELLLVGPDGTLYCEYDGKIPMSVLGGR